MKCLLKINASQRHFDPSFLVSTLNSTITMSCVPPKQYSYLFLKQGVFILTLDSEQNSKQSKRGRERLPATSLKVSRVQSYSSPLATALVSGSVPQVYSSVSSQSRIFGTSSISTTTAWYAVSSHGDTPWPVTGIRTAHNRGNFKLLSASPSVCTVISDSPPIAEAQSCKGQRNMSAECLNSPNRPNRQGWERYGVQRLLVEIQDRGLPILYLQSRLPLVTYSISGSLYLRH